MDVYCVYLNYITYIFLLIHFIFPYVLPCFIVFFCGGIQVYKQTAEEYHLARAVLVVFHDGAGLDIRQTHSNH